MSMPRRCLRFVVVLALACAANQARAQSVGATAANEPFSRGAAAYASGDRPQAVALLADAIRSDPHDPRPYYLRALCLARTGHPVEARADLVVAAALEARQPDRYPVEGMLAQLAVPDRTLLNQFRWRSQNEDFARAFDAGLIAFAERPVPTVRTDAGVLRQKASVPLDALTRSMTLNELAEAATARPAAVAVETGSNPFSDDSTSPHELPPPSPADATAADDPFGAPAAAATNDDASTAQAEPADPFAGDQANDPSATSSGKVPSSKLMGILGRAFARAAPVPAVGRMREQLPDLPLPIPGASPAAAPGAAAAESGDPLGAGVQPTTFTADSDFGAEPAASETPSPDLQQPAAEEDAPATTTEEDPFG